MLPNREVARGTLAPPTTAEHCSAAREYLRSTSQSRNCLQHFGSAPIMFTDVLLQDHLSVVFEPPRHCRQLSPAGIRPPVRGEPASSPLPPVARVRMAKAGKGTALHEMFLRGTSQRFGELSSAMPAGYSRRTTACRRRRTRRHLVRSRPAARSRRESTAPESPPDSGKSAGHLSAAGHRTRRSCLRLTPQRVRGRAGRPRTPSRRVRSADSPGRTST